MVDPLSVTSLAVQIGSILKQLYEYGKAAKSAQKDIRALCSELSALRGILLDFQAQDRLTLLRSDEGHNAISDVQAALDDLLQRIAIPQSRHARLRQALIWPLTEIEVTKILDKLERMKTLLLLDLMGDIQATLSDFEEMKYGIKQLVDAEMKRSEQQADEAQRKLLKLIGPISPDDTHRKACLVWRDSLSGSWFLNGPLKHWLEDADMNHQVMALVGISGAGKSTLISRTIEHLRQGPTQLPLAYVYCTHNESATRATRNILGSWVAQLASSELGLLQRLERYASSQEEIPNTVLLDTIVDTATTGHPIILVLDAINESSEPQSIASAIAELVTRSSRIKVLISSTLDAATLFQGHNISCNQINMVYQEVQSDIEHYIEHQIDKHDVLRRVPRSDIMKPILPRTGGMFRWADCQMAVLQQQLTPKLVKEALHHLPGTLDATYESMLMRVPEYAVDIVRQTFVWLSYSLRPLRLAELVDAVVLSVGDTAIDDDCRIFPRTRIIELCKGLAVIDSASDTVSLAHGSVRAFFHSQYLRDSPARKFAIEASSAIHSIVRKCLTYLLLDEFQLGPCSESQREILHGQYPLLGYAASIWPIHAYDYCLTGQSLDVGLIERLFLSRKTNPNGGQFAFWIQCMLPGTDTHVIQSAEPLYYAASFGLTQVATSMINKGLIPKYWEVDHKCGRAESTALQVASWRGHVDIVSLLLKAGADPNSTNKVGVTCVHCAQRRGFEEVERLLVQAGGYSQAPPWELGLVRKYDDSPNTTTGIEVSARRTVAVLPYGQYEELYYANAPGRS